MFAQFVALCICRFPYCSGGCAITTTGKKVPITLQEISNRALAFSREWKHAESEDADAKSFWDAFFEVFGVSRRRVATFERRVKKIDGKDGYIDLLWKGTLLVEHKSRGKDLDRAYKQAKDYFPGLKDEELPHYLLVSDFARFRLYDLDESRQHDFQLRDLHKKIHLFGFIAGYRKHVVREQDPVNVHAVQQMGYLHDALKKDGYAGHALEHFLVRLLFCLFADDTGIFQPKGSFRDLIETWTSEDGATVGPVFEQLFDTLNRSEEVRQKSLPDHFALFPYVNGKLFEERIATPAFNGAMRKMLLDICALSWGAISPAIFGAMFQKVIELDEKDRRRQLGAHYTSEANILKLIGPLFLDELRAEFDKVKSNQNKLFEFWKKLANLHFLDPACGCGNFLVITYRELRRMEMDVLRAAEKFSARVGSVFHVIKIDVDQVYGIEIEEFPAQVAQVAMWLVDHQMNIEASEIFGEPVLRIPLLKSANIRLGNALRIDWAEFIPPSRLDYILGNPPFVGKQFQTEEQKRDLETVMTGIKGAGVLDFVTGWYVKAAQYLTAGDETGGVVAQATPGRKKHKDVRFGKGEAVINDLFVELADMDARQRRQIKCAFVSTNSISQGEQVGVLWSWMLAQGIRIHFAHRTFQWTNDAPGKAAVHCVIIGFAAFEADKKRLFEYADIQGPPHEVSAENINPYLVDAPNVALKARREPISKVPPIVFGSMPNDGGHLLFSDEEMAELLRVAPAAAKWVRPFIGADEFLNNIPRWCLWLVDCPPGELKRLPAVMARVEGVHKHRNESRRPTTNELAKTPTLFGEIRQPSGEYLLIPSVSSERRHYVPVGFMAPNVIASNLVLVVPGASRYHFGVVSSAMHNAWVRYVAGRLKSDFRYSNQIVYNNFPWPEHLTDEQRKAVEHTAQGVLDAREAEFKRDVSVSLATLYDPDLMPPALVKAHQALDRAVDAAYVQDGGKRKWASDAERVAFLFRRYRELTSLLPDEDSTSQLKVSPRHMPVRR